MKNVLITGGAGLIGFELSRLFLERGAGVTSIDDFSGAASNTILHENFVNIQTPIQDIPLIDLSRLVRNADIVIHLAATLGVQRVLNDAHGALTNNLCTTVCILDLCGVHRKPLLIASSSEVYGRRENGSPLREDMDLSIGSELRWGYAAAKLADEFLARSAALSLSIPIIVSRIFNCIGPRQSGRDGMVVPRMMDAVLHDRPIEIYGDGNQRRSFTDVRDTAELLYRLVHSNRAYGQIVNVGNPYDISINELATLICRVAGKEDHSRRYRSIANAYGHSFDDIRRRVPNITRLTELTGLYRFHPLQDTIRNIWDERRKALMPSEDPALTQPLI